MKKITSKTKTNNINRISVNKPKKAALVVQCCNHRNKYYELLARFESGMAIIGAKRELRLSPNSNIGSGETTTNTISGEWKLINGVDWSCIHCSNESVIICACGTWSCDMTAKNHQCPSCKSVTTPEQKITTKKISGKEKRNSGYNKLLANNRNLRLPHK